MRHTVQYQVEVSTPDRWHEIGAVYAIRVAVLALLIAAGTLLCAPKSVHAGPVVQTGPGADLAQPPALALSEGDFQLQLNPDGQAFLMEKPRADGSQAGTWKGTWMEAGGVIYIQLLASETGAALKQPALLEGVVDGNTFTLGGIGLDDLIYDRHDLDFTVGSGQRHPAVRLLNRLLSELPYLNYAYPPNDDNLFTEDVRRALARFQEVEGYAPTGVLDLRTLLALVTPGVARLDTSKVTFTVGGDVVNVRSGPSTDYPVVQRVYAGNSLDVVGKVGAGTPTSTWLEICCIGQDNGWVRSDLGSLSGDLNQINVVPADQLPAPAATQPSTGRGQPLLADLPTTTPEGNPVLYLTFDDGPNGGFSQQILDLLNQYDANATFFLIGRQARGGADVLRRMATDGHYLANHTWDHVWLDQVSKEDFYDQIQRTRNELVAVAGDLFTLDGDVLYVRPPYGALNADDRQWMADLGYTSVLWDVDPQDWRRPGAGAISSHVISHAFPGAVVLMHDGGGERTQTVAALQVILRELSAQGYRFYNIFGQ